MYLHAQSEKISGINDREIKNDSLVQSRGVGLAEDIWLDEV